MSIKNIAKATFALTLASLSSAFPFAQTNFFQTDDANWRPPHVHDKKTTVGVNVEFGSSSSGRDSDGNRRNVLQLHDETQSALFMLFNPVTLIRSGRKVTESETLGCLYGELREALEQFSKDKLNGTLKPSGDFAGSELTFYGNYKIPVKLYCSGTLSLDWYLPVKSKRIRNVSFDDLSTRDETKEAITNNLISDVKEIADLDLSSIDNSGIGDFTTQLSWKKGFRKDEKYFGNIYAFAKAGVAFPTSESKHEDKAFSMALGNDGHWGFPFGLGIEAEPYKKIKVGVHADFLGLLSETRMRRLKTLDETKLFKQSEFLLLNKGRAKKDPGFQWQISPFLQLVRFEHGLSFKVAYQYTRHDADKLTLKDENFESVQKKRGDADKVTVLSNSNTVVPLGSLANAPNKTINAANSLKRWDIHNVIFQANWDLAESVLDAPGAPQLSIFYKRAFGGHNVIDTNTFGGQLTFNF